MAFSVYNRVCRIINSRRRIISTVFVPNHKGILIDAENEEDLVVLFTVIRDQLADKRGGDFYLLDWLDTCAETFTECGEEIPPEFDCVMGELPEQFN